MQLHKLLLISCIFFISVTTYAYTGHTEFTLAGGIANANFNNSTLDATTTETDTLHQTNKNSTFIGNVGVSYDFLLKSICTSCYDKISDVSVGLNLYSLSLMNQGDVYQYGDASLNNYNYRLPISSTRLMIDGKVIASPWHKISPFIIVGMGMSWNRAKYYDQGIALASNQQLNFAYEGGVGIQTPLSQVISLFIEYLYANLGNAKTASTNVTAAVSTPLHVNSGLIGINFSA